MAVEAILIGLMGALTLLYSSWFVLAFLPRRTASRKIKPSISIIVPAHDEERDIAATVGSILSAEYPGGKEVIVVDDGSTDRTGEIVRSFSKTGANVRLIRTGHVGKAKAINAAIKRARNEIFIVLDADTEIEPDALERIVQPFANRKVAAVASTLRVKTSNNLLTWFQQLEYAISTGWRYVVDNARGSCIVPGFCAFRKSMLAEVGGLKGDTAVEDYDICMYLKKAGYEIGMAPSSVAYTKAPETIAGWVKQRVRWTRGTLQVLRKHRDVILNRNFSAVGLYSMPTQVYWFFYALVYLPLVLYQILAGYAQFAYHGNYFSADVVVYSVKWLTTYGMADFIYNVAIANYPLSVLNALTTAVLLLGLGFAAYCIFKFSKPSLQSLFAMLFLFPYTIAVLSVYVAATLYQILERDRGERWEKTR